MEPIPVGDPAEPLGIKHVDAHQQIVDYLVELSEQIEELTRRVVLLEEVHFDE